MHPNAAFRWEDREAMRALESRGLIGIRPGEGAFVREVSVEALVEPLPDPDLKEGADIVVVLGTGYQE